jgi:hypothetical protein
MMRNKIMALIAAMALTLNTSAANIKTDRTWYVAGEVMTVNVTADDALIAYAELCDTQGLAAGSKINLHEGKGIGTIELPTDLHSGYYVLSVYTRHSTKVYHRLVAVVNPLHKSADDNIEWVEIAHADSSSYSQPGEPAIAEWSSEKGIDIRETEGHIIKARIKNTQHDNTIETSQICPSLSIVGKQIHYFEGQMVNDSIAVFYTYGIHGKHPLVLSALSSSGVSLPIEMISPFASLLPKRLPRLVFHYRRNEVETRSVDMQRQRLSTAPTQPLVYDDRVLGTQPELTYNLDEYRQFLTIREVLLEYVMCVSKREINGITKLVVRDGMSPYHEFLPSLVLIDGMPVVDTERLLNYDARRMHHINIYGSQYTFGRGIYNGILSFVSRTGQLTNYPTEHNMQYLEYEFP